MRTKTLPNGKTGTLICGGPGFKIYSTTDPYWTIDLKGKLIETYETIVARYVCIKYHPISSHSDIKARFNQFLKECAQ
jgi:hypothetical protein